MELKQIFPSAQNGSSTLHYEEQAQEKTVVEWVAMGSRILLVCHSIIRNTEGLQSEQAFDELCKIIVLKVIKDEQREREIASLSKDIRIKSETLRHVLSELDKIDAEIFRHTKGAIFEDFLSNLYRNGLSEYLTPPNVVDYMVSVLAPQNGERICDPCCGSGRFLIKSYEYVKQTTPKPELKLLGIDISRRIIELAKMNMFMNNIKHFDLVPHDGLLYDDSYSYADNMFDVVFASPPFGVKVEHEWISERYNSKSNRVDILLIERCLNILKPSGRMGIVLSEGVLFSSANKQIHKFIESQAKILQIASLPKGTFPNMGIKASILFFQKFSLEEKNAYAFVAQNSREDIKKHLLSNTKLNYDLFYADITDVGNTKRGYVSENNQLLLLAKEYQNVIKTGSLGYSTLLKQIDYAQIINWSVNYLKNIVFEKDEKKQRYPSVKLSLLITKNIEYVKIDANEEYKRVTVRLGDNGVVLRDKVKGDDIGTKRQVRISKGQLIVSKIGASSGAIGIVPNELDNAIVTQDFLTYYFNTQLVIPDYLVLLLSTDIYTKYFDELTSGSVIKRLDENRFLNIEIPLPPLNEQIELCKKIRDLKRTLVQTVSELQAEKRKFENSLFEK